MTHRNNKLSVADFLAQQLEVCGKLQKDVAQQAGFDNHNIITMLKQGLTKVPFTKVGPLARALGVDPIYFLRLVMGEYAPDTLLAIEDALDTGILTKNERELIDAYRNATAGIDASAIICDARDVIAMVMV